MALKERERHDEGWKQPCAAEPGCSV